MTRKPKILLPLALLAAGVVAAVLVVRFKPDVERREVAAPPPLVRVVEVSPRPVRLDVTSQGTVEPRTATTLVAQVSGRILSVSPSFAAGGFFERGRTLLEIDPRDFQLAVSQAESQLAQARLRLEREEAEAAVAREEWRELGRGEPGPLVLRLPQLAEARAAVEAAEAAVEQARLHLARTTVGAPFTGRVRNKLADLGQFVNPGTPLAEIYAVDYAEVRLPVAKEDLSFIDLQLADLGELNGSGPAVVLSADLAGSTHSWRGRIVRTAGEIDRQTRMLDLFARIDDPYARRGGGGTAPLPVGLFVQAAIEGRTVEKAVVLPRSALRQRDPQEPSRWVMVVEDDRARFRQVEILRTDGERAILHAGLEAGDRVVVSPLETPVDGMRVRTTLEQGPAEPPVVTTEDSTL